MTLLYRGTRTAEGCVVTRADGTPLDPRLDLRELCRGFDWGAVNSGAAQLALAVLADYLQDDERAVELHLAFKRRVVVGLPKQAWSLAGDAVDAALAQIEEEDFTQETGGGG